MHLCEYTKKIGTCIYFLGGFGIDFSTNADNVEEGIDKVARGLLSYGVTSFCPTVVTSPTKTYHKILPRINKRNGSRHGAGILGAHIEGPFISPSKKGAHPESYIRNFNQVRESQFNHIRSKVNL